MAWTIGQKVVVVRHRGREVEVIDAEIAKIGRKWLTVKYGRSEEKFDFDGRSEQSWGVAPRIWPDRQAYEADVARQQLWRLLQDEMRRHHAPPAHVSVEKIAEILAALRPTPPKEPHHG